MKNLFRKLLNRPAVSANYRLPAGERVYPIGDIHGRLDLFQSVLNAIRDHKKRAPAQTTIVLLGDLIDHGPKSAGVIDAAMQLQSVRKVRILMGYHKGMFLDCLHTQAIIASGYPSRIAFLSS